MRLTLAQVYGRSPYTRSLADRRTLTRPCHAQTRQGSRAIKAACALEGRASLFEDLGILDPQGVFPSEPVVDEEKF